MTAEDRTPTNQPRPEPASPEPTRRTLVEAVVASTVGTTIEWYDFFLYGTAATIIFPRLYFPGETPYVSTLLSIGTYTIGFVARPVGAVIFGHLGDRVGRKSTLVATLLLMGLSTFAIAFLPTYQQIGIAAPLVLTCLRIVQGVGVGGEWGGAVLLALEFGHRERRGFYASWPQAGVPLGLLLSTGVLALLQWRLPEDRFMAWGWRIAFLLSGILIVIGFLIRLRILETPLFAKLRTEHRLARAPVIETLRHHWRNVLLASGTRLSEQSYFYLFSAYVLVYGEQVLHLPSNLFLWAVNAAAIVEFWTIPFFGHLSDRFTRRRVYALGCLFFIVYAFPYFALLQTGKGAWIFTAVIVSLGVGHAMLYSVQAALIPELFGTRIRYTGASLGYQLASPFAGGLAPLLAVWLKGQFPEHDWPLALYIIVLAVISLVCVRLLVETSRRELGEEAPVAENCPSPPARVS